MKKRLTLLFSFLVMTLLFQNCSRVSFQSGEAFPSLENNGRGYGGKPDGNYYHFIPNFSCEQKESPVAHLKVQGELATFTENKRLLCGAQTQTMDTRLIDFSIYQRDVVGYQERIFEGKSTEPTKIPANLVEIWCRDRNDEQGIETITHFNNVSKEAVNRIYYSNFTSNATSNFSDQKEISDFAVARVIADRTIIVKDDHGFELTVHRDQPAQQMGLFKAELKAVIEGQKISRETSCRLGGSLDPKVWPAQQVVEFDVIDFQLSPDQTQLTFATRLQDGTNVLLAQTLDGTNSQRFTPMGSSLSVSGAFSELPGFLLSPDGRYLVFSVMSKNFQLWVHDLIQGTSRKLSDRLLGNSALGTVKLSADGFSVIFLQYCGNVSETCLTSVPLRGGTAIRLDPPKKTPNAFDGATAFEISLTQNKVIFWCCDQSILERYKLNLYSINIDGTELRNITPTFPSPNWRLSCCDHYLNYRLSFEYNKADYFWLAAHLGEDRSQFKYYVAAIDGSGSVETSQDYRYMVLSSPTGQYIILNNSFGKYQPDIPLKMMNLKSGQQFELPLMKTASLVGSYGISEGFNQTQVDSPLVFSPDSSRLIGSRFLPNGNLQAVSISTSTGAIEPLCPEISDSELSIKVIAPEQYLIVSYNQATQNLSVFKRTNDNKCTKLNSTVATNPSLTTINQITLSPDQQKLLVRVAAPHEGNNFDQAHQIFYIPLNGQPALLVNIPVFTAARSYRATFLKDSRSVLYFGDQIRPDEMNLFLWTAP